MGRTRRISVRRSMVSKRNSDEEDFVPEPSTSNRPEVPSTINQRPRRQVKHKFIKTSSNRPMSLTDELYTALIGPNSPSAPALVPVVERLSNNVANLADLLASKDFELVESAESTVTIKAAAEVPMTVELPMAELKSNSKEPVTRAPKTLGIPMRRRGGRQTRTSNNLAPPETNETGSEETNHTSIEMSACETVSQVVEIDSVEDDTIVTIEETDDRFEMDFGPVDFAQEVVIEETVTSMEFGGVGDDSVAAAESDAPVACEEVVDDIIDVSDSLSIFNESDDSDSKSVVDVPMPSSPFRAGKPENDAIDMDENSGSIILVSPCDPLDDSIAATEEITCTTFDSHLADDDTANDGDVDETPLNGPRRRSKRKSKSIAVEDGMNPVNNDSIDGMIATVKTNDEVMSAVNLGNSKSPPKENAFHESNSKSESATGSWILPQNNFVEENVISSSEETTQSESNDRSGAFDQSSRLDAPLQRPRREAAERINYSVRRNYVSRQSMKNEIESTDIASDNIDAEVDVEAELEKSVIERPQPQPQPPIEPKFKFKKTDQMRTYQRRQKARGAEKESSSPPPSSSSSSSLSSSSSAPTSVPSSPKPDPTTNSTAQMIEVQIAVTTEQSIDVVPTEDSLSCPTTGVPQQPPTEVQQLATKVADASTDSPIELPVPKRRSAGRPRKSDARRKPPQQTKLANSIEIIPTNADALIEAVEKVEIVDSSELEQVLPPVEAHEEIKIEIKADLVEETEVPNESTAAEITQAPSPDSPDELLPKVENLVISTVEDAAIDCKMEIDEEKPIIPALEPSEEVQLQPAPTLSIDMVDASITAVDDAPTANDNGMEIDSNDQTAIKDGEDSRSPWTNLGHKHNQVIKFHIISEVPDATEVSAIESRMADDGIVTDCNLEVESPKKEVAASNHVAIALEPVKTDIADSPEQVEPMEVAMKTEPVPDSPSLPIAPATVSSPPIIPKEFLDESDDTTSIRRSGRIKTINKSKQPAQGFGLVKEKKRFIEDDAINPSADRDSDQLNDKDSLLQSNDGFAVPAARQKTQEELEKEQIDRENGMKLFAAIIDNEYRSERVISKEAKKMACDCFMTQTEMERGELGCGDDCLNRMLLIECGPRCNVGDRCTNKRFQRHENADCTIFKTEKKGYGLIASSYIPAGVFIMEYVGEVLNSKQFEKRASDYSKLMIAHYYFMALSSDCVIDATKKGNISRFINHSCDPNAETQKWTVNGELRIGFFSSKPIMPGEEVTFDYQFQRYGYVSTLHSSLPSPFSIF